MAAPRWLRRQLSGPTGWLARPVAVLLNRGNGADYIRAVPKLRVAPGDAVLELGFGGGVGVQALLGAGAEVTAVEPAVAMRARAYRKHAWAAAQGQLHVVDGRAEALPDGPFVAALSMNTVYFWSDVRKGMSELARVVTGRVVLGVAPVAHLNHMGFEDSGFRVQSPQWYADQLAAAGFEIEVQPAPGPNAVALVIGTLAPGRGSG